MKDICKPEFPLYFLTICAKCKFYPSISVCYAFSGDAIKKLWEQRRAFLCKKFVDYRRIAKKGLRYYDYV